jgi:hypothetical protein
MSTEDGKTVEQALSEFMNGIPLPLCLYIAAGKAAEQGKQSVGLELVGLSELCRPEEYAATEAWLRAHKRCGACSGPLYEAVKKPELECNITPKGFEVRVICGVCADAKRALLVFWELMKHEDDQPGGDGPYVTVDLKDILPPEEFAAVDRFLKSKRFCDECLSLLVEGEEVTHMNTAGPEGVSCYSICGACNKRWESEAMLPNILTALTAGEQ